jgi:hypothetical protein
MTLSVERLQDAFIPKELKSTIIIGRPNKTSVDEKRRMRKEKLLHPIVDVCNVASYE